MNTSKHEQSNDKAPGFAHIIPARLLVAVWLALLVLTAITVASTKVDLGALNIWIAMLIATAKASLVLLFFMHLRYEQRLLSIMFLSTLIFVTLFISVSLLDTMEYQSEMIDVFSTVEGGQ